MNTDGPMGIEVQDLTVAYDSFAALDQLTISLPAGRIVGIVGPNGAGKTTLLNAISGFTHVDSGTILLGGTEVQDWDARRRVHAGIVRSFQTVRLMERESVLTNVLVGTERHQQPSALAQLLAMPSQFRARRRDVAEAWRLMELLHIVGEARTSVYELPFAARRLVEVARVLVSRPQVVLLDEPAAGLDRRGRSELALVLACVHERHPSTMVIVEHDVDFVRKLCAHVVALDSGSLLHSGTPNDVFGDPRVQLAYFGRHVDASA